jgi:SAM-dependent methyltransferase
MNKLESVPCDLCGDDNTEVVISREPSNIVRCKSCGLIYRKPRNISSDEIEQFNQKRYSEEYVTRWGKLRRFDEEIRRIERYASPGKLLDIGCQFCEFLKVACSAGWDVHGVDPSLQTYEIGVKEKLNIFHGVLKDAGFKENIFDVVTLLHVFDQIPSPKSDLLEIKRVLKRDGLLVIRLPNADFHLLAFAIYKRLKNIFKALKDPSIFHLYMFSSKTLCLMLKKAGFKILSVQNSKPSRGDIYDTKTFDDKGRVDVAKRMLFAGVQIINLLTLKRIFLSPSIEVIACNKK